MINNYKGVEDIISFSEVVNKLRQFCLNMGFLEVHTQDRLSILAACEDPDTVATYKYMNELWPLPQTGQMWLEYELLTKPQLPGVFCVSTSYRNEPNPVPGRHKLIFPIIMTVIESLSPYGSDNFTVPVLAGLVLKALL